MSGPNRKLAILFLCTGNSCRSQMAEGWTRHVHAACITAYSAGIEQHGLNPLAVQVMAEAGVDISGQRSKLILDLPLVSFDWIITLCDHAHETCPFLPGRIMHRGFPDPPLLAKHAATEEEALRAYRTVRDQIRDFVTNLPQILHAQP